jgi:hypothetical protein
VAFGVVEFDDRRYKTSGSSRIDVKGYSGLAGIGKTLEYEQDKVTGGVIFEYGKGYYKTRDEFVSGTVKAKGNNEYVGG